MAEQRAAPLRDGPLWERVLRTILALLLAAWIAHGAVQWFREARLVTGGEVHGALVNDIAEGAVTTIDDSREDLVLWRLRDGEVFAERAFPATVDLRATVAAQPYVRDHPGAVRYGAIDARDPRDRDVGDSADAAVGLAAVLLIVTGPPPRLATRWGWFWLSGTGVGPVAYLLLSGSRRRTVDDDSPRVGGKAVFAVAVVFAVAMAVLLSGADDPREGEQRGPGTAAVVQVRA